MSGTAWFAPARLQRPAIVGGARDWSWHEVHAAAAQLATRLEAGAPVCNLCSTRVGFLVTTLAALRRGCLQLLPPSGGQPELLALLAAAGHCTIVVDDETPLQGLAGHRARTLIYLPQPPRSLPAAGDLAWRIDADRPCASLYTSGSTGAPQPHAKTWGQLLAGAHALAARLDPLVRGGLAAWRAIVSSVPPQHMFGFESSVLLPLATGLPVLDRRPLLPLDVRAAFALCGGPAAWIATPLHLRALAQSGENLPDCRLALVSTMPLAAALAGQVEALVQAPVVEIYGSTETGAIATRRTACEPGWQPLDGVRLAHGAGTTQAWGAHFPSPHLLGDQVEAGADGRFTLLGRHADMVKIGGRRASLAALNLLLQQLPGLDDGVFYLPGDDSAGARLVLLHAGALERAPAERWLREHLDAVFLPRTWVQVERLPRDGNGKLARSALAALYAAHRAGAAAQPAAAPASEFRIAPDHPCLAGHFPGRPIVPGVLILDHVLQALRQGSGRSVTGLPRVKFSAPLLPGETASVQLRPRAGSVAFCVRVQRAGALLVIAEGSAVLGPVRVEAAA
jgi:acyl-coenzyme A synthetase/AMP-(fatty) acid ligase